MPGHGIGWRVGADQGGSFGGVRIQLRDCSSCRSIAIWRSPSCACLIMPRAFDFPGFVLVVNESLNRRPVEEVAREQGVVPHHVPGSNPFLKEFGEKYNLPIEATLVRLKREYPGWGAPKIREKLRQQFVGPHLPAISTVHAVLDRMPTVIMIAHP